MAKIIYFHVGTVKTGTTSIQKALWENREVLKKLNSSYLDITLPKLEYPRYANAEFIFDPQITLTDLQIEKYIQEIDAASTIISEEGLWANLNYINKPAFNQFEKHIILYVRKPSEVIAAWASENALPYNANLKLQPSGDGVVPISEGIERFADYYANTFHEFFRVVDSVNYKSIIVRPFAREQLIKKDVLSDFLKQININPRDFYKNKDLITPVLENQSKSRKYCDVSYAVINSLKEIGMVNEYGYQIVDYVYQNCKYGDDRSVLDTLNDEVIENITEKLKFVETELSNRYLDGRKLFKTSLPSIFNVKRFPYQPLSIDEINMLTYRYLLEKNK